MWWIDPDDMLPPPVPKDSGKKEVDLTKKYCYHEWYKIKLIISTVENCKNCGVKKEDWQSGK
jgi:hypothetical protein